MRNILGEFVAVKIDSCEDADGTYCDQKKEITIEKKIKDKHRRNYVEIHELVHAIFDRAGICQGPNITIDIEEIIAHCIATAFIENYDFKPKQVD